jgi:hypothetical protein
MTPSVSAKFAIRHNRDGSLDAICLKCFVTAGTTMNQSGLTAIERTHECDPNLLVRLNTAGMHEPYLTKSGNPGASETD